MRETETDFYMTILFNRKSFFDVSFNNHNNPYTKMKKTKKIFKIFFIFLLAIILIRVVYEQIAQIYFNSKKPPASEFVDINSISTHFVKKGSGGPTIVFQSGLGGDYKIWEQIQDSLSQYTTTISYDRAGLQWSEDAGEIKTLSNITSELETLLNKTNCPKPYILVGHSLAGITLRPFIKKHKDDISGIVFIDVSHPQQIKKSSEELKKHLVVPPTWVIGSLVETGIIRTYFSFNPFIKEVSATHPMNQHITDYFYKSYKTILQEAREDDPMFDEADEIKTFGDIPLTIITGTYPNGSGMLDNPAMENEYLGIHLEGQKDLLNLSTHSKQIAAPKSGHYVPLNDYQVVIAAIREMIEQSE